MIRKRAPIISLLLISLTTLSAFAEDPQLEKERNDYSAKRQALTEEWDRRAKQPGVNQVELRREMNAKHKALDNEYLNRDPRSSKLKSLNEKLKGLGMRLESTGGSTDINPNHINADVDAKVVNIDGSPVGPEQNRQALEVFKEEARARGQTIEETPARVNSNDDMTAWKTASPEGQAANQSDFDANATPGGLHETRNANGLRDEAGAFKDLNSKYQKARVEGDLKTQAKAVVKAAANEGNTRPRIIEGPDGPTFELVKGTDAQGNTTYSIPRDPKPGLNQELIDKAKVLKQEYGTTHQAGITTPGAEQQTNKAKVQSFQSDADIHMEKMEKGAVAKGGLRRTIGENFAQSYENASSTGSGEAGQRTRLNPETGKFETGSGAEQLRDEARRIREANASVDQNKVNPNKNLPTAEDTFTGGRKSTAKPSGQSLNNPELNTTIESVSANATQADLNSTPKTTSQATPLGGSLDSPDSITMQSETPTRARSRPQPLTEGKSSFSAPSTRDKLNNLPDNLDDAASDAYSRVRGGELDRSEASSDAGGKAATALSAGIVAGTALVAASDRAEANKHTAAADKAKGQYDAALENNDFDRALEQNKLEFDNRTKADSKNDKAFGGAIGAGGGALELLDGVLETPAAGLAAVGQSTAAAMDGFQTGNAVGKAEIARQRASKASAHAARLRARGLNKQAEKYEQIAAESHEAMLTEAEAAVGGTVKTAAGIVAAGGSQVAGVGLGAYTLTRLAIDNTKPGKALEDGKANLGARIIEWWNGAPEKQAEAESRARTISALRSGLRDGTYVVMDDVDKDDIDKIIDTANRTGDFTHVTTILTRPKPRIAEQPEVARPEQQTYDPTQVSQNQTVTASNNLASESDEDWEADFDEFWDSLDDEQDDQTAGATSLEARQPSDSGQVSSQPRYDDGAMLAALGTNVNNDLYDAAQNSNIDGANAREATAFERESAQQSEHEVQMSDINRQGRATESAISREQAQHDGSMRELQSKLDRRAQLRDAIAGGLSSGLQDGVYTAGRRLGDAVGDRIYEPEDKGGCGGCGGGGGGHSDGDGQHHDDSSTHARTQPRSATAGQPRAQPQGATAGQSNAGGSAPSCDRASEMIDELHALQQRFISSNGAVSVQPRHDQIVNSINAPLNQCSSESPSRSLALLQKLQNSPLRAAAR